MHAPCQNSTDALECRKALAKSSLTKDFYARMTTAASGQAEPPKDKGPAIGQPPDEVNPGRQTVETVIGAFYRLLSCLQLEEVPNRLALRKPVLQPVRLHQAQLRCLVQLQGQRLA